MRGTNMTLEQINDRAINGITSEQMDEAIQTILSFINPEDHIMESNEENYEFN